MTSPAPLRYQTRVQEQFCIETRPEPCGMVIFGASGDLAERKLFPSLFGLKKAGLLPKGFYAVGVGRTSMDDRSFRERVRRSVGARGEADPAGMEDFLALFHYHAGGYDDPAAYASLAARLAALDGTFGARGNVISHLSVPPGLYAVVARRLAGAGLSGAGAGGRGWSRLIVEKPFGRDQSSARELDREIRTVFKEEQVYRIDHYLGKETVQAIMVMRFANILFEPLWNRDYVDHVQITVAEDLGVGARAGYYEEAGVLRDMFQNHLFQLLCVAAMEPPAGFAADRVRDEKAKVLGSVRPFSAGGSGSLVVTGQYGAGGGKAGYRQEPGVSPDSSTETFAAMSVYIDNWRWRDVPFYMRSGKRLARRCSEIVVQFKPVPHLIFEPLRSRDLLANALVLRIQPQEGMSLSLETKHPGPKLCMSAVTMDFDYESSFGEPPEAYERLFLDCMAGDPSLFIRSDWVDLSWGLLSPLLSKGAAPRPYAAGSWGPPEADALLAKNRHAWRNP